jgi:acyl-[acyl-carrier-protein]-phospholipid O-acyltransferase / long-chain-fatty-acid--[acyl-carrier-protein] ligase
MATGKYSLTLKLPGLQPFLWTQFLGAFNDNLYKMVVLLTALEAGTHAGSSSGYVSLVGALYILPYFLFSGYAGNVADIYSKRSVLVTVKLLEIGVMLSALLALYSGRIEVMLAVLFLMALNSTFFSPAKYGILPEMLPDRDLSRANGLLEMSTFLAIILGTSLGSMAFAVWKEDIEFIGFLLIVISIAGMAASLRIPKVPASGAKKLMQLNPWTEIRNGIRRLRMDKSLWLTVIGISYFWFLGALLQMDIPLFGKEILALDDLRIGFLLTFLAVGIGIGSMLAGRLSGDKVELGLVPLGSFGVALFSLWLASPAFSYGETCLALAGLGFAGGVFVVPLNAMLQQRSGREEKGQLIATNNFLNTGGILLASGFLWLLHDRFQLPADRIILTLAFFTLAATVYILTILPDFLIRFTLWMLTHTIYKVRIIGQEHVPFRGPALLVCNHISHVDALLVAACLQRFIRFMVYRPYYELKSLNWLFRLMKAIPVSGRNRKEIVEAIEQAREELRQGHVVCIFAEGAISRTGNLLPFKRGVERILEGLEIPIIPVYLEGLWGSIFSFKDGRFFWKWPRKIPYPVTVVFGHTLPSTATASEARRVIMELGSEAIQYRRVPRDLLQLKFLKTAKRRWFSLAMSDSTGKELNYGSALIGSLLLSRLIRKQCRGDSLVGILLPASVAGALANVAVLLAGKVPVNLNFSVGQEMMASAIQECNIRAIITSKNFLARAKLEEMNGMVFLEDLAKQMTPLKKLLMSLIAFLLPSRLLGALYGPAELNPNALATVIFSSGSTGTPKGVMLSHHNILSNIEAIAQIFWITNQDRMMGVLPFFHSFGLTGTLWLPLIVGFGVVYHSNPMDAKTIGEMVSKYRATILISTPTFYAAYLRRCTAEEFSTLHYAIVGAEKLREPVAKAFKEKYGLDLLEGYGCTEMGPVVAVNIPDVQEGREHQTGLKRGTVGHPVPGVAAKVIDPDNGGILQSGEEGLLLVKGPSRMMGYWGQSEKTAEVLQNGWYLTGDVASVDDDGFIRITDRLSRFSKIGGEMVPHIKIEETVNQILGDQSCVVTSIPDEQKGERLIALYTRNEIEPQELWDKLNQTDLPKLWIPKRENLYRVEAIPLLGTGKVDLKRLRAVAIEMAGR